MIQSVKDGTLKKHILPNDEVFGMAFAYGYGEEMYLRSYKALLKTLNFSYVLETKGTEI